MCITVTTHDDLKLIFYSKLEGRNYVLEVCIDIAVNRDDKDGHLTGGSPQEGGGNIPCQKGGDREET